MGRCLLASCLLCQSMSAALAVLMPFLSAFTASTEACLSSASAMDDETSWWLWF